jgi:hypothetical protein
MQINADTNRNVRGGSVKKELRTGDYCTFAYSALACFRMGDVGVLTAPVPSGATGRQNAGRREECQKMDQL